MRSATVFITFVFFISHCKIEAKRDVSEKNSKEGNDLAMVWEHSFANQVAAWTKTTPATHIFPTEPGLVKPHLQTDALSESDVSLVLSEPPPWTPSNNGPSQEVNSSFVEEAAEFEKVGGGNLDIVPPLFLYSESLFDKNSVSTTPCDVVDDGDGNGPHPFCPTALPTSTEIGETGATNSVRPVNSENFNYKFWYQVPDTAAISRPKGKGKGTGGKFEMQISPWHDIPYIAGKEGDTTLLHFVCEIPKGTSRKYEIVTKDEVGGTGGPIHLTDNLNSIMQDRKTGKPIRFYKYQPDGADKPQISWNYGAIAQTFENPKAKDPHTGELGDGDPIDVVQLNDRPCETGEVQKVRPLGIFALIDEGETDWKMIVVDADDSSTNSMKKLTDVPKQTQVALIKWFQMYKTAEKKPQNMFWNPVNGGKTLLLMELLAELKKWEEKYIKDADADKDTDAIDAKLKPIYENWKAATGMTINHPKISTFEEKVRDKKGEYKELMKDEEWALTLMKDEKFALEVADETHEEWCKIQKDAGNLKWGDYCNKNHLYKFREQNGPCFTDVNSRMPANLASSYIRSEHYQKDCDALYEKETKEMFYRKPINDYYRDTSKFKDKKLSISSEGDIDALDYKIKFQYDGARISPWHDIPYSAGSGGLLHFVCEIPKNSSRKYEIQTKKRAGGDVVTKVSGQDLNPIMQDRKVKNGVAKLREYKYDPDDPKGNTNPHISWNYGAIAQTWENPEEKDPHTGIEGDGDPIDVVQLNDKPCTTGEVQVVRPIGIFALIDDGETDWKMLVVNVNANDAKEEWTSVKQVDRDEKIRLIKWFQEYKTAEKGPEALNKFWDPATLPGSDPVTINFDGSESERSKALTLIKDEDFAMNVAHETNCAWMKLVGPDGIAKKLGSVDLGRENGIPKADLQANGCLAEEATILPRAPQQNGDGTWMTKTWKQTKDFWKQTKDFWKKKKKKKKTDDEDSNPEPSSSGSSR